MIPSQFPASGASAEAEQAFSPALFLRAVRKHWPIMVSKTKALWATRVVIDASDLAAIQIPVLVMSGDHDVIPLEETLEIYRQLPHGQLCILPATGHATMQERPEEFNRLTRQFLEETRKP